MSCYGSPLRATVCVCARARRFTKQLLILSSALALFPISASYRLSHNYYYYYYDCRAIIQLTDSITVRCSFNGIHRRSYRGGENESAAQRAKGV